MKSEKIISYILVSIMLVLCTYLGFLMVFNSIGDWVVIIAGCFFIALSIFIISRFGEISEEVIE